jgi:hypothetical protein
MTRHFLFPAAQVERKHFEERAPLADVRQHRIQKSSAYSFGSRQHRYVRFYSEINYGTG